MIDREGRYDISSLSTTFEARVLSAYCDWQRAMRTKTSLKVYDAVLLY